MGFEGARDQSGKRDVDLRQKYFDAIAQLEAGEARWSQLEVTLRRLIGRLCLAARGRATSLDIELRKVSDLARGRGDMSAIEESLEPLSRAIAALDDATLENSGATTTSRALAYSGYVPPSADTSGLSGLRPELHAVPPSVDLEDDEAKVQAIIVAVLERLSRLPELRPALGNLCERSKDSLSPEEFAEGLERVARLVGEQRATLMREKREIETLLQQMDLRLAEIASYLASDSADQKSAQTSSQQFDLLVTGEVRSLSNDVQITGDLAGLRNRVRDRLAIIANHLQDFRAREGARVN